ncbi:MAG: rod shape-determining protein [Patescibacteria group bacterium]
MFTSFFRALKKKTIKGSELGIGIDLGTANTLVYIEGKGIVLDEPSVVAVNQKTNQVVAVGNQAKIMLGKTPGHITAIRPLVEGVISDFEVTEEMLAYVIRKTAEYLKVSSIPTVVIGVPFGVTNVERRAVRDAARNAGARTVYIIEEPMAAAIGIGLPIHEAKGSMIIDIGGGTTDIAIISLGGIVKGKNLKVAGDRFNNDIIAYIRNEYKLLVGEKSAEQIKIELSTVSPAQVPLTHPIRGRDLVSGLPKEIVMTDSDIHDAIHLSADSLFEAVKEVLESCPPEIVSDIMVHGIWLTGGGALIKHLAEALTEYTGITVRVAEDPLTAVARGAGIIAQNTEFYQDLIIENEDELPIRR